MKGPVLLVGHLGGISTKDLSLTRGSETCLPLASLWQSWIYFWDYLVLITWS